MLKNENKNVNMLILFIILVALIILIPQSEDSEKIKIAVNIINAFILLSWIYAFSKNNENLYILFTLWIFIFLFFLIDLFFEITIWWIRITIPFLVTLFYIFTTSVLFSNLLNTKKVSSNTIFWAINTFILLWLLCSTIFWIILSINPNAFQITWNNWTIWTILYFSFCTITTLGHWDIIPISPIAKSVVILESIAWVMYVAIVIPRFISLYIWNIKNEFEKDVKKEIKKDVKKDIKKDIKKEIEKEVEKEIEKSI